MAIGAVLDRTILVGGIEVAGHVKSYEVNLSAEALDTTAVSATAWRTLIAGRRSTTFSLTHMADMVDGGVDDSIFAAFGVADTPKSWGFASSDGATACTTRGIILGYTPLEGEPGALAMGQISGASSTGQLVRGKVLHPSSASRTSSSAGTGRELGALSASQSLSGALHVLSVAGTDTPTLTVKVQSDDNADFTSATDRITFVNATAVGAQWGTVAGAVTDTHWRVTWTISGTNPAFSFVVVVGRHAT